MNICEVTEHLALPFATRLNVLANVRDSKARKLRYTFLPFTIQNQIRIVSVMGNLSSGAV